MPLTEYYLDPDKYYKELLEEKDMSDDSIYTTNHIDSSNWSANNLLGIS